MKAGVDRRMVLSTAPAHPWFSAPRAGLIVWRMPARLSNEDIVAGTTALQDFLIKGPMPCAWILDMSQVEEISATQRKMFAENERRIAPLTKLYVSRLAYVVPSPMIRAVLTAYFWVWHPPYPYSVFGEWATAETWALAGT